MTIFSILTQAKEEVWEGRRGGRGGGGQAAPLPIILEAGPTYPLALHSPNNPPTISFNVYVKQKNVDHKMYQVEGLNVINVPFI